MNTDFLNELNDSQKKAVLYNEGASLVIAGAGSGKTRVLTCKIAYLLSLDYKPSSILALTFTNKAAREMKERIGRLVGDSPARRLWMGTFHSIFLRILRANAKLLDYEPQFTIYDTDDSKSLLRSIIKEMNLNDKEYAVTRIQNRISNAKNHLILPSDYDNDIELIKQDNKNGISMFHTIYHTYINRCKTAGAMDFDDLLVNTYLLFKLHPDILAMYVDIFRYILVDEYQDTNFVQREILLQLGKPKQHVCVVGDDAQSIYSFRGANIENILSFETDFNNVKVFKLEQNYRSTQNIVLAANSLIEKNQRQIHKSIFSKKDIGEQILVSKAQSDIEEASIVVKNILKLRRSEDSEYSDFAILYRTNAQSRVLEEELRKYAIPYGIYGGVSFYQRKEIKDIIAYFRLIINPNDEEAIKRIINYPTRGIGDTTMNKIKSFSIQNNVSIWTVLSQPENFNTGLQNSKLVTLHQFVDLIQGFIADSLNKDAYSLGKDIIQQTGLLHITTNDSIEDNERKENIGELLTALNDFITNRQEEGNEHLLLSDYLSDIALLTDQDTDKKDDIQSKVTMMTIHSAKGLEFPTVFVVGLEENLFPNYMSMNSERELEEERRLFYVAITRAERHCFLSFAESRYHFGKMEFAQPSRFLKDIDVKYLRYPEIQNLIHDVDRRSKQYRPVFDIPSRGQDKKIHIETPTNYKPVNNVEKTMANIDTTIAERLKLKEGQLIEHERFGVGEVIRVEGEDENKKATIQFRNSGEKVLLLRFARFKIIG